MPIRRKAPPANSCKKSLIVFFYLTKLSVIPFNTAPASAVLPTSAIELQKPDILFLAYTMSYMEYISFQSTTHMN